MLRPRNHRLTLLIGDDDPAMRGTVAELLEPRFARVLQARCGEETLQLLLSEPVDLTILDIHMPDMTGMEVFERFVRGTFIAGPGEKPSPAESRRLAAIFMSGDATPEIRHWCEHVERPLLDKPFAPDDLRAAIDAVLGDWPPRAR